MHCGRKNGKTLMVATLIWRNGCEPSRSRLPREIIMPTLAFKIAGDLRHDQLAHINHCGASEMIGRDFGAHRPLSCSSMSPRPLSVPPAEYQPGPPPIPSCTPPQGPDNFGAPAREELPATLTVASSHNPSASCSEDGIVRCASDSCRMQQARRQVR